MSATQEQVVDIASARAAALREAADSIEALHPGEVKNSVLYLRARARAEAAGTVDDFVFDVPARGGQAVIDANSVVSPDLVERIAKAYALESASDRGAPRYSPEWDAAYASRKQEAIDLFGALARDGLALTAEVVAPVFFDRWSPKQKWVDAQPKTQQRWLAAFRDVLDQLQTGGN